MFTYIFKLLLIILMHFMHLSHLRQQYYLFLQDATGVLRVKDILIGEVVTSQTPIMHSRPSPPIPTAESKAIYHTTTTLRTN